MDEYSSLLARKQTNKVELKSMCLKNRTHNDNIIIILWQVLSIILTCIQIVSQYMTNRDIDSPAILNSFFILHYALYTL
eukprot:UN03745